jgi:hypothetical protein
VGFYHSDPPATAVFFGFLILFVSFLTTILSELRAASKTSIEQWMGVVGPLEKISAIRQEGSGNHLPLCLGP